MTDKPEWNRLCNVEELAAGLGRSRTYVSAMKAAGFEMPGGMATVSEARIWLKDHPGFSCRKAWKGKKKDPEIRSV